MADVDTRADVVEEEATFLVVEGMAIITDIKGEAMVPTLEEGGWG